MKPFEIFKPGKHTPTVGGTLDFSEDMLRRAAEVYDPKASPAAIVVGHPKYNHPAYGWVGALQFNEAGVMEAVPEQVEAQFAEMVKAGRFRTRSASWYLPGSPNHPLKGTENHDTLYLRHVGFLGAQPPAIKGLKDVSFSEDEEGVVEFADARWTASLMAGFVRRMREWAIEKFGMEEADKIAPQYLVSDLEAEARAPIESPAPAASFSESDMTPEQIQALQAKAAKADQLEQENATLKANAAKHADFAERETNLAAREAAIARTEIEGRVDALIKAGKAVPAQKKSIVDFAMSLAAGEATVDFGEGDAAKKVTQRDAYLLGIENGPNVIDFGERAPAAGGGQGGETLEDLQKQINAQVASGGKADK